MTRFEANFVLFLACYACGMVSNTVVGIAGFGILALYFGLRAAFPRMDRLLLEGE